VRGIEQQIWILSDPLMLFSVEAKHEWHPHSIVVVLFKWEGLEILEIMNFLNPQGVAALLRHPH
jgi:hypothetical protein